MCDVDAGCAQGTLGSEQGPRNFPGGVLVWEWRTRPSTLQQTRSAQTLGTQRSNSAGSLGPALKSLALCPPPSAVCPKALTAWLLFMGEPELSKDKHPDGHPAWVTPREPAAQQAGKALLGGVRASL